MGGLGGRLPPFVEWSESKLGFYPGTRWNQDMFLREGVGWEPSDKPIVWPEAQRRLFAWAFTPDEKGRLPIDSLFYIDIAKTGKTMIQAAVAQWIAQFADPMTPAEVLLAANSVTHAAVRCFRTLQESLQRNPYYGDIVTLMTGEQVVFAKTGHVVRPVPKNAFTQAGSNNVLIGWDELWAYNDASDIKFYSEMKPSPTRNFSFQLVTTYPGYAGDKGPLALELARFMDEHEQPHEGVEQIEGLEDLPVWRLGRTALWWNHEHSRYPWLTVEEMQKQRDREHAMPNEFRRKWEARIVQPEDSFISAEDWDGCTDTDWAGLLNARERVPLILGIDIGVKHDSSAAVARGFDTATGRYPLYAHKIWTPSDYKGGDQLRILRDVEQWVLDLHRQHRILCLFYDPSQAQHLALRWREAGIRTEEVGQNRTRESADTDYRWLVLERKLRNYPGAVDLRRHVLSAVARYVNGNGIRLDKTKTSQLIDAAVADSMCCYGVTLYQRDFERLELAKHRPQGQPYAGNPFAQMFKLGG